MNSAAEFWLSPDADNHDFAAFVHDQGVDEDFGGLDLLNAGQEPNPKIPFAKRRGKLIEIVFDFLPCILCLLGQIVLELALSQFAFDLLALLLVDFGVFDAGLGSHADDGAQNNQHGGGDFVGEVANDLFLAREEINSDAGKAQSLEGQAQGNGIRRKVRLLLARGEDFAEFEPFSGRGRWRE